MDASECKKFKLSVITFSKVWKVFQRKTEKKNDICSRKNEQFLRLLICCVRARIAIYYRRQGCPQDAEDARHILGNVLSLEQPFVRGFRRAYERGGRGGGCWKKVYLNKLHSTADLNNFKFDHFFKLQNVVRSRMSVSALSI